MTAREELLEALWRDHTQDLMLYALRRCRSQDDAYDLVAEVFLVVWRRIDELPAPAERRPWMFGVARNVLNNQKRGIRRRTRLAARLAAEAEVVVPDHAPLTDAQRSLQSALACVSPDARELLMLVALEGLSSAEAGVALGIAPATARVRLHRARKELRKWMERDDAVGHVEAHNRSGPAAERVEVTQWT